MGVYKVKITSRQRIKYKKCFFIWKKYSNEILIGSVWRYETKNAYVSLDGKYNILPKKNNFCAKK
jgi:hypothetical protein